MNSSNAINHPRLSQWIGSEPFRVFFPLGVLGGVVGVSLWPLHFLGWIPNYPGTAHARLMAQCFFGNFIIGFLATALPRMLGASPLNDRTVAMLAGLQSTTLLLHARGFAALADLSFLTALLGLASALVRPWRHRIDLPPPGFVLAALGLLAAATASVMGWIQPDDETGAAHAMLRSRLLYQGFTLLPVLGVGGFIFPGLLGLPNHQDFPSSPRPSSRWSAHAIEAGVVGLGIFGTFGLEMAGWTSSAHFIRGALALGYLWRQVPFTSKACARSSVSRVLRLGLWLAGLGLMAVAIWPSGRVPMLHLTLASGLALVTLAVATRVIFGHSGQRAQLHGRHRWLMVAIGLMLLGTLTRITGDFLPKILPTHYGYGALCWAAGLLVWAYRVFRWILTIDLDETQP